MKFVNGTYFWKRAVFRASLLILILMCLSGCAHFMDTSPVSLDADEYKLCGSHTLGQTFVCHHAGLDGISVLLRTPPGSGDLTLRPSLYIVKDIRMGALCSVAHTLRGAADELMSAIIRGRRVIAYAKETLWLLFLSILLHLLPGGAAAVWLLREGDWIERLTVAVGLSVAINALLLYATMTGLRLDSVRVIAFLVLCGLLIAVGWSVSARGVLDWQQMHRIRQGRLPLLSRLVAPAALVASAAYDVWERVKRDPSPVALLIVFALVLGVRIFVVRDLVAPMWGDSYHHTMIAQLIVDNGGLFDSWEPYVPLATFTYHFGFHANVALFHWLSKAPIIGGSTQRVGHGTWGSMIWVGQITNALAVLALYPLALKVSSGRTDSGRTDVRVPHAPKRGNRWAGVGAVLVAGLLSPMPMYYVNWGRYAQLSGQVVLPVLMWLTWCLAEKADWDWRLSTLTAIAGVGLGITHYRVILIYGVFVVALGIVTLFQSWRNWRQIGQLVLRLTLVGCLVVLIFAPWGVRLFSAKIPRLGHSLIKEGNQDEFRRGEYNTIGDVSFYVPRGLVILSLAALVWQSLKREWAGWLMALWVAGMLILANPYIFHLPGTGIVNNFAIFIMLYVPVGILAGALVGEIFAWVWHWKKWARVFPLLVVAMLCVGYGIVQRMRDLCLEYALVTEADMEAMAWIRESTPPDARFLVNGFLAFGDSAVVGADAGWWIPLLTGRGNTVPPVNYGLEISSVPKYWVRVNGDFLHVKQYPPTRPEGLQFLQSCGITHIYIGQGGGMVGNPGQPLLEATALLDHPAYRLVYHRDGVWVFALPPTRNVGRH